MKPRDTRTGAMLESLVLPALEMGGYAYELQQVIGMRPGGQQHKVDAIAYKNGQCVLISLKWQQVSGSAEQKVPYEVICLAAALAERPIMFHRAYLVLGGDGWRLREFFIGGGLQQYLRHTEAIAIVALERFLALANSGRL